jgi:geranylgeranyl diphosphate synthase, type II
MRPTFEKTFNVLHARVEKAIAVQKLTPSIIGAASRHSLSAGGKRLRPILTVVAATQRGRPTFNPMPIAVAIECIHTFSLIHDDMPCIDDATLRRGKKCCHKVFGEAAGLLAGDSLLNKAYQIVTQAYPAELAGKLCELLSQTANDLIEGEWADIEAERLPMKNVDLDFIYMNKTARMIGLPIRAGLTLAGFEHDFIERQAIAAEKVGVAFQLVDDILDEVGDAKKLGKNVAQDARKKTFLKQYGQTYTEELSRTLSEEAIATFRELPKPKFLIELAKWLLKRDY